MLLAMSNRFDRPFRFQRETPTIRSTICNKEISSGSKAETTR